LEVVDGDGASPDTDHIVGLVAGDEGGLMERLYERMTALLGQQYDGDAFQQFITELEMEPVVISVGNELDVAFPELGVAFATKGGTFATIFIHINTPSTPKPFKPFDGELADGIRPGDSSETVKEKLRMTPSASRRSPRDSKVEWDLRESYDLGNLRLSFTFDGVTGLMYFVSVSHHAN